MQPAVEARFAGLGDPVLEGERRRLDGAVVVQERTGLAHHDGDVRGGGHAEIFCQLRKGDVSPWVRVEVEKVEVDRAQERCGVDIPVPSGGGRIRELGCEEPGCDEPVRVVAADDPTR